MKITIHYPLFLAMLVLLELNAYIHGSCVISRENQLTCTHFDDNFLEYSNEYENLTYVHLFANFTEIRFDSRFTKLSRVQLYSESLVNFTMNNLNNLTSLVRVFVISYNYITTDLHFNSELNNFKNFEILELNGVQSTRGKFCIFCEFKRHQFRQI